MHKSRSVYPRRFCIKQNNHGSEAVIHVLSTRGELQKVGLDPYPTTLGQDPYPTGGSHSFIAAYWVTFGAAA